MLTACGHLAYGGLGPKLESRPRSVDSSIYIYNIYIYTSADPCISMHVAILALVQQQSQVQGVKRPYLRFMIWNPDFVWGVPSAASGRKATVIHIT